MLLETHAQMALQFKAEQTKIKAAKVVLTARIEQACAMIGIRNFGATTFSTRATAKSLEQGEYKGIQAHAVYAANANARIAQRLFHRVSECRQESAPYETFAEYATLECLLRTMIQLNALEVQLMHCAKVNIFKGYRRAPKRFVRVAAEVQALCDDVMPLADVDTNAELMAATSGLVIRELHTAVKTLMKNARTTIAQSKGVPYQAVKSQNGQLVLEVFPWMDRALEKATGTPEEVRRLAIDYYVTLITCGNAAIAAEKV